jgi:ADP-ribose pyrophosphatase
MTSSARIATRRVYDGRVISVDVDQVRFPNGSTGELEMIRHSGASAVLPFVDTPAGGESRLLLIRQYRYAAEAYLYEIPAGRLDPGESPDVAARRELLEETGCTARQISLLTTIFTTPGFTDEKIHLFYAEGLERGAPSREADEFMETEERTLAEAVEMVERGEIVDGKSMIAILMAARLFYR